MWHTLVIIFVFFLVHIEHAGDVVQLFGLMVTIRPRRGDKIPACRLRVCRILYAVFLPQVYKRKEQ